MQRRAYLLIVVAGLLLGLAIGGLPSRHHDAPLQVLSTTTTAGPTTTLPATTAPTTEPATTTTTRRR